jgi:hypothetical protein
MNYKGKTKLDTSEYDYVVLNVVVIARQKPADSRVSGAGPRGQFGSATKGPRCRYSMAAMISAMTRMADSAEFFGEVRNPQGDTGAEL